MNYANRICGPSKTSLILVLSEEYRVKLKYIRDRLDYRTLPKCIGFDNVEYYHPSELEEIKAKAMKAIDLVLSKRFRYYTLNYFPESSKEKLAWLMEHTTYRLPCELAYAKHYCFKETLALAVQAIDTQHKYHTTRNTLMDSIEAYLSDNLAKAPYNG